MRFLAALSFLTLLPVRNQEAHSVENLKHSSHLFPWVGLIIGGLLSILYYLSGKLFPSQIVATIVILFWVILTRGLHADGFSDFFDGFFGGSTKEEKLNIMKDSRLGAFGFLALLFLILLKIQLLTAFNSPAVYAVLLLTPLFSRWSILYVLMFYPYAKEKGLGRVFEVSGANYFFATLYSVITTILISLYAIIIFPALFILTKFIADYIVKKIGGMTGDVYGFLVEFNELAILLLFFLMAFTLGLSVSNFAFIVEGGRYICTLFRN